MELIEQHFLPDFIQRLAAVVACERNHELQFSQGILHLPVELLVARGGGKGALMPLEIQLALPYRRAVFALLLQPKQHGLCRRLLHRTQAVEVFHALGRLQMIDARPATAVAHAEENERLVGKATLGIVFLAVKQGVR